MNNSRPGLNPQRLVALMREAVKRCSLDLSGATVLTEAASGAYVVTPVLAAMAGAQRVFAVTRTTRYGSAEEVARLTSDLATLAGANSKIEVLTEKKPEVIAQADIVTNSGHVRPIDAAMVAQLKPTAVVPLMYEAWELREGDVDIEACRRKGIAVAGTNERHPAVDVFSFLGIMAVKQLLDAGVAVYGSRIALLCDNDFAPFIERGLTAAGANVRPAAPSEAVDAVVVALRPRAAPVLTAKDLARWPGAVITQFWGDIERGPGLLVWPPEAPPRGHMGVLPSAVGPEPIVRLQSGGLKVGQVLLQNPARTSKDWEFVDALTS